MPGDQELKNLVFKRGQIKAKIKRNKTFLDKCIGSQNVEELKIRLGKTEECWQEFEDVQSQIESIDTEKDHEAERDEFEQQYYEICGEINSFIKQHSSQSQNEAVVHFTSNNSSNHSSQLSDSSIPVRLPTINLPNFSGKYDEWMPFFDSFTALIDNNNSLTDIQKLHYLKAALLGDAANVIKSLELTASNYNVALSLLKDQFQNTRLIVQQHVRSLFELPHVQRDNPTSLRQLINNTLTHLRALEALDVQVDQKDPFVIHIITTKLDTSTLKEWELTTQPNELPTVKDLTDFLQKRCQILENINHSRVHNISTSPKHSSHPQVKHSPHTFQPKTKTYHSIEEIKCEVCDGEHPVFQCRELIQASHEDRLKKLSNAKLCFNCLRPGHRIEQCKSRGCKKCNKKHNTALHYSPSDPRLKSIQSQQTTAFNKKQEGKTTVSTSTSINNESQGDEVLLSTALVDITSPSGIKVTCRAFLDSGSQSSFMTESLCQRLKLKKESSPVLVTGISDGSTKVANKVQATFNSRHSNYAAKATFLVLPKITGLLPTQPLNISKWNIPQNISLADPTFSKPSKVDILLGQEYFYEILEDGRFKNQNTPVLQNTKLGWIFGGRVNASNNSGETSCHLTIMERLDKSLQAFWKIEEEPIKKTSLLSTENKLCEELYNSSIQKHDDGRYIVNMPFKQDPLLLGNSKETAIKRFHQVERRFKQNNELHQQYKSFMKEYEELGHMEKVSEDTNSNATYYLPHHPVVKQSSTTTKLRVVFDASAKTTSGTSLNDTLMIGPTLQDDIFSILLRFRIHPYVFTADIEKMYRQIWIHPSQRDFLRIVWREDNTTPVFTYRLNTVTYGTACAPYLAIKTLRKLAQDEEEHFPEAAKVVMKDFYVDDVLTGTDNIEKAIMLRDQLIELLKSGGFNLRKFNSNSNQFLSGLSSDMVERKPQQLPTSDDSTIKTLGVFWDAESDKIKFKYTSTIGEQTKSIITKRTVLSDIAKLFDPLGIISPIIINAKIFMQDLWKQKIDWDGALPEQLSNRWQQFKQDLHSLNSINVSRCVTINQVGGTFELHGFSDASEKAYGATIYLRHELRDGTTTTTLLCSKSRVAPLKTVSLPRLELCGALLLTELMASVKTALIEHNIEKTTYWTDSTIVLAWLSADAASWKTFIANRVSKIQELSDITDWRHVRSEDNPADLVSRGMTVEAITTSDLWNSGPTWLSHNPSTWPVSSATHQNDIPERKKPTVSAVAIKAPDDSTTANILEKVSRLKKLIRITAYCMRFITNCRKSNTARILEPLTPDELNKGLKHWILHEQKHYFPQELKSLSTTGNVHKKSKLVMLHPFQDNEGIIRVGGRLDNAAIESDQKHPIVLPSKSRLTQLIIENEHTRNLHAGPQTVLSIIRQQYWPLNGKNEVRKIIHKCVTCFKVKPRCEQPEMGNLPAHRINPSRPFAITGVDYCGPIYIRSSPLRRYTLIKSYIAVFVCFTTKAIHLELVSDLTTEAFLAAFKRFISRRGLCQHIYSDNGTNFVGAHNELKELYTLLQSSCHQKQIINSSSIQGIKWHFIPPKSPHFGGLWEAGVKSVKQHLWKVVGNANLTFEKMYTVLTMIEACLNSRPLTPLSCDPKDPLPLTPGHFLTGQPLTSLPEPDFTSTYCNRLSQWQHLQQLMQHFWRRWSREYLSQLQQRQKWMMPANNIQPGQVVIIREENLPPLKWITAIVEEVHPGVDGKARVATVRTSTGTFKRAVNRLCVLPIEK